jgi:DeoR family fructose operon transcriptional repressor
MVSISGNPCSVFCLGGRVRGEDYSSSGVMSLDNLEIFNTNKLIMSIGGITPDRGLTDYRMDESALVRSFIDNADCVIGIADHSKFGVVSRYNICPAARLTHLITDSGTPEILYKPYQEAGVHVHVIPAYLDF